MYTDKHNTFFTSSLQLEPAGLWLCTVTGRHSASHGRSGLLPSSAAALRLLQTRTRGNSGTVSVTQWSPSVRSATVHCEQKSQNTDCFFHTMLC